MGRKGVEKWGKRGDGGRERGGKGRECRERKKKKKNLVMGKKTDGDKGKGRE